MKSHLEGLLRDALDRAVAAGELRLGRPPVFAIEVPSDPAFGDLASNVAMILARVNVPPEGIGLILGVDRFLDMCRTTLNVTGDLCVAVVVARGEARR